MDEGSVECFPFIWYVVNFLKKFDRTINLHRVPAFEKRQLWMQCLKTIDHCFMGFSGLCGKYAAVAVK